MENEKKIELQRIKQYVEKLCRRYYQHSQPEDRQDIAADVALIAAKKWETVTDEKRLAWLFRTAKNVVRNESRRAAKRLNHQHLDCDIEDGSPSPEAKILYQERDLAISATIQTLNPIHRQVIGMYHYESLSIKAISEILHCPQSTVKRRLADARAQLAKRLSPILSEEA
jgi:RNA polymerase sigma-70 factor, ECF subfamily